MTHSEATAEPSIIPRSVLFGESRISNTSISPDGRHITWLAPYQGVANLWISPVDNLSEPRPLTMNLDRGISSYSWASSSNHILYSQDGGGDENYNLYAIRLVDGSIRNLTPFPGARATLVKKSTRPELLDTVLVSINKRDPKHSDIYRLCISTGTLEKIIENHEYAGFFFDASLEPRLAVQLNRDGSTHYLKRKEMTWTPWLYINAEDARTTKVSHISADGSKLYLLDSRGRDTTALVSLTLSENSFDPPPTHIACSHTPADISTIYPELVNLEPAFFVTNYLKSEKVILNPSFQVDIEFLDQRLDGNWSITSRSSDDRFWVIAHNNDITPTSYNLYDRASQNLSHLHSSLTHLPCTLSRMQPCIIQSRDGLNLVSYLTIPHEFGDRNHLLASTKPLPLVLAVHGGPWARDMHGFNPLHQWLANRGYAVLSVNFRGSSGFGKSFLNMGNLEWGGKMDNDLTDAVEWAITRGVADPGKIAIMGGSYGGYATLWALTQHPSRYACGIDIVGPSDLRTLLNAFPPHWESFRGWWEKALGSPATEAGRALLHHRSPLTHAGQIRAPLLIAHGANDPRVKQAESDQMVSALRERGVPVTYVLYPDEGHGLARPANHLSFTIIAERFLAKHLGGRFEEPSETEAEGNTAIVTFHDENHLISN